MFRRFYSQVGPVRRRQASQEAATLWLPGFVATANHKAKLVKRKIFHFQIDNASLAS
jgi:hypothetical protein